MADALKRSIATTAFLTSRQRNTFFADGSFPADLTSAKVRFNARAVLAAQFLLTFFGPNFANRDSAQFFGVWPSIQTNDFAVFVADVLAAALKSKLLICKLLSCKRLLFSQTSGQIKIRPAHLISGISPKYWVCL